MKKTKKVLLLGLAALAMTACNKEENGIQSATGNATISFVIKTGAPNQRAVGEDVTDAKITSLTAMVYSGQTQEAIQTVNDPNGVTEVKNITCKSGKDRVLVVVANSTIDFAKKTLSEVEGMTINLTENNQASSNLVMTGKSESFEIKKGDNSYGYPQGAGVGNLIEQNKPLQITRVHAGMTITKAKPEFSEIYAEKYSFSPKNIAGLICKKTSKIFGQSLVIGDTYLSGLKADFNGDHSPTASKYEGGLEWMKKAYAENAGFYILESDYSGTSNIHPTILCVYGPLLDKDGNELKGTALQEAKDAHYCDGDGITYYPVWVNYTSANYTYDNSYNATNKIVRNNHYQISLTITGPGTDNPENPISEKANLKVNCKVTPWVVVGQHVEW